MSTRLWIGFILLFASKSLMAQTPPGLQIQNISAFGTGCPGGSYSGNISPDGQTFSLLLDNFVTESSMQSPIARMNCDLRVTFQVPRGWTFAVLSADYRGYAYAERGVTVTHQALYSFDGSKPRNERPGYQNGSSYVFRAQEFVGPFNDNYNIRHEIDPRQAIWAPCGNGTQTLFLTTFLMARNLNLSSLVTGQITLDSIDGNLQAQNYRLAWRTCSSGGTVSPAPGPNPRPENPGPRPPRYPGPGRK